MHRIRTSLTLVLALALISAIGVGCNTGTEEPEAPESESAAVSDTANDETPTPAVEPQDIDPSRFPELREGVTASVPSNFPKDLPIYPGAVPAQGREASADNAEMSAVQLLTNDSPEEASRYYRAELESKGWTIEKDEDMGDKSAISVVKDGCKASFMFIPTADGRGTDIFTISTCDSQ
jgi:hypothetical protein